jgi:hypothetical protein
MAKNSKKPSHKETDKQLVNNQIAMLKAENARLNAEVRRLKLDKQSSATANRRGRLMHPANTIRNLAVILLVALSVILLTAANLLFWTGNTIVKQDRFVAATQPIIKDAAVQDTMALYVTNSIFNNVDVQKTVEQALPPKATFLAPQLTSQLKNTTDSTIQKALANPDIQNKWNTALAKQHDRLINFAANYKGDGNISLNDFYTQLSSRLSNTKLAFLANKKLPPKVGNYTVVNAAWLPKFHNLVVNIDTWRLLAVVALVLFVAGAVWLSKNRRRTIYTFILASAAAMIVTLIILHFIKDNITSKVNPLYSEGVNSIIQIVSHSLVLQTLTIFFASLFIGFVAWISSPASLALKTRRQVNLLFNGNLHGRIFSQENKFTVWVQKYKRILQWFAVAAVAAIMLLVRLTLPGLILYGFIMLILVLTIEAIAGQESKLNSPIQKRVA